MPFSAKQPAATTATGILGTRRGYAGCMYDIKNGVPVFRKMLDPTAFRSVSRCSLGRRQPALINCARGTARPGGDAGFGGEADIPVLRGDVRE